MTTTKVEPTGSLVDVCAPDTPGDLLGVGFPDASLVSVAAGAFRDLAVIPGWDGSEGRRYRLSVAPGAVQLAVRDLARSERTDNDPLDGFDAYLARHPEARRPKLRPSEHPTQVETIHDAIYGYGRRLVDNDPGRRDDRLSWREVTAWSSKSRRRMQLVFAQLDYAPLFAAGVPAMVTLTYPGSWLEVAPNGRAVKAHFRALERRWFRRWRTPLRCLWKLEFQRRGAPHLHLFVVPPGDARAFRAWLSLTWADIVGADASTGERRRHVLAGTAVDYAEAARMRDPRRLAVYFMKHGQKTRDDKEYQHVVPMAWRGRGDGPGRFWGYRGLEKVTSTVELHGRDFVVAKRVLRRWSRAQGRTRPEVVQRVDVTTGVLRRRRVTRRTYQFGHSRLAGGWVVVNAGPSFASQLARALRQ